MCISEKCNTLTKGHMACNGKPTRDWLTKEDTSSPTVGLDSSFFTSVIDVKEKQDVMTADVPNAFIQTALKQEDGTEKTIVKIAGVLVGSPLSESPLEYEPHVVCENGCKVLCVEVLRAIHGTLVSALLFHSQFKEDLEGIGFEFNQHEPSVANGEVNGKQQTIRFHVDNLMSGHADKSVNNEFWV